MNLQQLRYLLEIQRNQFNISKAANILCTSQSGISKQIQLLEQELQLEIFQRNGKHLLAFSEAGEKIGKLAEEVLGKVNDIKSLSEELNRHNQALTLAATHTQARYVLPTVVQRFIRNNPSINLHIHQGTPTQIATMLQRGQVDIAIATEALANHEGLLALPCYQWGHSLITDKNHPLTSKAVVTLHDIVKYPIITYVQGFTGRYKVDECFAKQHLLADIVLTAVDADVIKTYVRLGLGIGIIAEMAVNEETDLKVTEAKHLFGLSTSLIAIKKDKYIKQYVLQFIETFAPHLTATIIQQALACANKVEFQHMLETFTVPIFPMP